MPHSITIGSMMPRNKLNMGISIIFLPFMDSSKWQDRECRLRPIFAYLQGLIVLLAGSWFHYQILSNFILYLISGFSMLILLRYVNVRNWVSVPVAVLFMSTYSIQYWSINQGFTSWGTCFYPLCMIPIADFVLHKKFPVIKVAVSVGLMTQIHLLSSIMLALMYIPFYLYYFFNQTEKEKHCFN